MALISVSLDEKFNFLKKSKIYLVPMNGIKGNRNYSLLIIELPLNQAVSISDESFLYLKRNDSNIIQPVVFEPSDFNPEVDDIIVKLIDQGPNSGQYYGNASQISLSSQN